MKGFKDKSLNILNKAKKILIYVTYKIFNNVK